MVNQLSGNFGTVFVYDGESRRGNDIGYAELFANRLDKGGLAGSHFAVKSKHGIVAHCLDEPAGGFMNLV